MKISYVLPFMGLLLIAWNGCGMAQDRKAFKKVLLISLDTLRPDFLGCYNGTRNISPNIDRFARENILFTQATSQAPSTAVSHKSILYSLYPSVHQTTRERVPKELIKSPIETLQSNGFKTSAFVGGGELSSKFGFAKGFETYWEAGEYSSSDSKESLEILEAKISEWLNKNYSEKFFLFVHTYEIHCPYYAPKEFRDRNAGWYRGPIDPAGKCGDNFYNRMSLSKDDVRFLQDLYAAEIEYVDSFIGRLFDQLRSLKIYDEILIILLSDHGESLGERNYVGHNYLYRTQLFIPLIMRVPGLSAIQVHSPVEAIDVMPTLFWLLDVSPPYDYQGKNLAGLIQRSVLFPQHRALISEQSARVRVTNGNLAAVFSPDGGLTDEVYDVIKDPEEKNNIAGRHSTFLFLSKRQYSTMLRNSRKLTSKFQINRSTKIDLDDQLIEQLKALGYLQ